MHCIVTSSTQDNVINQKVLVRQLQAKGFKTSAASHGQEALDLLLGAENDVDVVLMDIVRCVLCAWDWRSRPRVGDARQGREGGVHRAARRGARGAAAHARHRRVRPLSARAQNAHLCRTGNAREEQVQECLALGFDEVAIKPYRITDIVRLIGSVLAVAAH